jgi:uncharacterized protein (UPF0332 family)
VDPFEADLQKVAELKKRDLGCLFQGEQLTKKHSLPIHLLMQEAAAARFRLAKLHLNQASSASAQREYRCAISRGYYAMYQSMRAVVFLVNQGDDHEDHSALSTKIPTDFPSQASWANELKNARVARNAADYDPYPTDSGHWEDLSKAIVKAANTLLSLTETYLKGKGVTL